jgi:FkbM family methyltransferase
MCAIDEYPTMEFAFDTSLTYFDEKGEKIDHFTHELPEQVIAYNIIPHDATVLELGARYGTVSCAVNRRLWNKQAQVVVEPDPAVWDALEGNRARNDCQFHIVKGFVSKRPLTLKQDGYSSSIQAMDAEPSSAIACPCYTVEQIQETYGLKFDTLIADCEGGLGPFFDENREFIRQLRLITFEKDRWDLCNYEVIMYFLQENGFQRLQEGYHEIWNK